jgi:hypothetical protein
VYLKISGRKIVRERLLARRLLDLLFTHFFDNRFDEFRNKGIGGSYVEG